MLAGEFPFPWTWEQPHTSQRERQGASAWQGTRTRLGLEAGELRDHQKGVRAPAVQSLTSRVPFISITTYEFCFSQSISPVPWKEDRR
jgi:hypothetical protein